ncbi:hypothetical protein STCU_12312 [Strigomonas culicis]|nr:hypothetical protein STCU_12312 [Strigomonas culicis]|eukprot:EPY15150.1 hypothetical protein STCU_12312 [Strigomonas culicis]
MVADLATRGSNTATFSGSVHVGSVRERREKKQREEQLLTVLSSGAPVSAFPLAKPVHQKQFAGGGFALHNTSHAATK